MKPQCKKVFLGDCIEIMKDFANDEIDLLFADPPYNAKNIGPNSRTYSLGQMQLPDKEYKKFCQDWFKEAMRISKRLVLTPGIANTGHINSRQVTTEPIHSNFSLSTKHLKVRMLRC